MTYAHEAPFDLVHDRLPYQAAASRPPLEWPGGAKVAVWVVPNIEHYEYLPPKQEFDPYPRTPHPEVRSYSYRDFGNRVGFWRMLEAIDRYEIPCTASLNAGVLDHFPEIAEAMAARNWDYMSHGLYNTRTLRGMTEDEERDFYAECNRVLERHTGKKFSGMLGPNITGTPRTPDLMAEAGMTYQADWVHDDRPSPLLTAHGPIVALPYTFELNDGPVFRGPNEAAEYLRLCVDQLEELRAEEGGQMMCIALHPFVIGQPHRAPHFEALMAALREHDDVWLTTATEIVEHYRSQTMAADLAALDLAAGEN